MSYWARGNSLEFSKFNQLHSQAGSSTWHIFPRAPWDPWAKPPRFHPSSMTPFGTYDRPWAVYALLSWPCAHKSCTIHKSQRDTKGAFEYYLINRAILDQSKSPMSSCLKPWWLGENLISGPWAALGCHATQAAGDPFRAPWSREWRNGSEKKDDGFTRKRWGYPLVMTNIASENGYS